MQVTRQAMIRALQDRLGDRKLVWVGTRGHDAASLMELSQFSESYGIIGSLGAVSLDVDFALEEVSGRRVDLDTYKIDEDRSGPARELRRRLLNSLTEPAVVVAYRPSALLSALCYPRSDFVTYLGMFHERQATFEHKPWVENELRSLGVPIIPWRYYAEEDQARLEEKVAAIGTVVVRTNRSDGGAGLKIVTNPQELRIHVSHTLDGFVAAAPLLEPTIPLNVNACVFKDGSLSVHPASLQLIGIPACTTRRFGYCGNDFGSIKDLDDNLLRQFDVVIEKTGRWLWSQGYVGAFGVDALIYDGKVMLTEVNPRFQGSSSLSARIDKAIDRCDLFLCHIAAHLGLSPPHTTRLSELVREQANFAQIIFHNGQAGAFGVSYCPIETSGARFELVPSPEVQIDPDATVFRAILPKVVTRNGWEIDSTLTAALTSAGSLRPPNSTRDVNVKAQTGRRV